MIKTPPDLPFFSFLFVILDDPFPDMMIEPSPPQVQENKRKRPKVQGNKRKRRPKFDHEIVFSNA